MRWAAYCAAVFCYVCTTGAAFTCERQLEVTSETKALMSTLENVRESASARVFALAQLACINDPTLRNMAFDIAIRSSEKFLRSKALANLLMQREGVRAKLTPINWTPGYKQGVVEQEGWSVKFNFYEKNESQNCINLVGGRPACYQSAMLVIDGLKVRINDATRSMSGEFALEPEGYLKGFITMHNNPPSSARIDLL